MVLNPSAPNPLFKQTGLFSHLRDDQIRAIERISTVKRFEIGEILFYEGEESRFFQLLIEGEVTVFKSSGAKETMVVHRFRAPSLIAEVAALKQIPYPASAECTRSSTVIRIERDPFLALLRDDPSLSIAFISSLTQKISALEASLKRHSGPNAMAKVARLIREEPELFECLKGIEIAALIGITPETLSRILKKFRNLSVISLKKTKGITITDPEKLNDLAENNFPLRETMIK